ncbi:hypothetical protein D9613_009714 [Agrocybe pediades]|uniref:Uncharacterized protein n=1 Tax=Agrocybe pediades TaxID=84607 RepID=A0A8H4QXT6_9AGAR|nr:hypothetical protein D9613_009714 [Agrocybe pediades]
MPNPSIPEQLERDVAYKIVIQEIDRRRKKTPRHIRLSLPHSKEDSSLGDRHDHNLLPLPTTPTTPFYADVHESASRALHDHIKAHDNYFPAERSPREWVEYMKEELGKEWDDYISRHQAHNDECEDLAKEIEEIKASIARENRIQCTRFMMAVKEKNRASQKKKLLDERDRLMALKETNEISWRDMLSGVKNSKEQDAFPTDGDTTMVAEGSDEAGPLSA